MCRALKVSHSGFYQWLKVSSTQNNIKKNNLYKIIEMKFLKEKRRAGYRRITRRLRFDGITISKNSVAKIMKIQGLRARAARKFKATTNSNHNLPVAPNLLKQNFYAQKPNEKWVSDITYISTDEGWIYLAAVMDLYSKRIIGWSVSERMTTNIVTDALQMALWNRKQPQGVIVHSDRGSQYCSGSYQNMVNKNKLICSMSKKGDCYDNAAMESWNHSFKVEAIYGEKFHTRKEAKNHIFEYIEVYYNRNRLHSGLGYLSPESFEAMAS